MCRTTHDIATCTELPAGAELVLYPDWSAVTALGARGRSSTPTWRSSRRTVRTPGPQPSWSCASRALNVFYDLDTPVTLERVAAGTALGYLGVDGLASFDLVLSYTGGRALDELRDRLGASTGDGALRARRPGRCTIRSRRSTGTARTCRTSGPRPMTARRRSNASSSSPRGASRMRFLIGGAQYPSDFPVDANLYFLSHVPPAEHPAFFSSSRVTLNVTRQAMAAMGYCPSGRLFEAAACGTAVLTDEWDGLDVVLRTRQRDPRRPRTPPGDRGAGPRRDELRGSVAARARADPRRTHLGDPRAGSCETVLAQPPGVRGGGLMWGIIPAAGVGSRIQPLAFCKELLPVGSRLDGATERPRAVSEYLVDRMIRAGADKFCFVDLPGEVRHPRVLRRRVGAVAHLLRRPTGRWRPLRRDLPRPAVGRRPTSRC